MTVHLPVRLAISGRHHRELRTHLFPGDGNEAVAFALCGRARRPNLELLLVQEVIPIPHAQCRVRTPDRVAWPGTALEPILQRAARLGLAVVKFHSHPSGSEWFSQIDDQGEADMFPSIFGWLDTDRPMASLIMLPDGRLVGRAVQESGGGAPLAGIRLADDNFHFWQYPEGSAGDIGEQATRVAQTFGEMTYRLLRKLRIGIVGASGTGSIVIEQLARNCVGELVIVDADGVEAKNLNRILNSTLADARNKTGKPEVQERSIAAMGFGTKVYRFDSDIADPTALDMLSTCDVVFGCLDSVDGRHILNKLASAYLIPLIDVGVRLDADGTGGIDSIWLAVHTVLPGGSSLMSRGVYSLEDLNAAFLKRSDPSAYEAQLNGGYIKGIAVDRPAVISVNMEAGAAAVNELLARIHPYRVSHNKLFAIRRLSLSDPDCNTHEAEGSPCPLIQRTVGTGDQEPRLGLPLLECAG